MTFSELSFLKKVITTFLTSKVETYDLSSTFPSLTDCLIRWNGMSFFKNFNYLKKIFTQYLPTGIYALSPHIPKNKKKINMYFIYLFSILHVLAF